MATKAAKKKVASKKPVVVKDVTTIVNGQVTGTVPATNSIAAAAGAIARDHGLRSFSILVDGRKVTEADAANSLAGHKTIEVFAKDARG